MVLPESVPPIFDSGRYIMTVKRASLLAFILVLGIAGCQTKNPTKVVPAVTKLGIKDLSTPTHTGADSSQYTAQTGDLVSVEYKGWLDDGTVFDSNMPKFAPPGPGHSNPLSFVVGDGTVIKGWEEGVVGMQLGQTRELTIPFDLAYGAAGHPPKIPPMATLHFDVKLDGLVKKGAESVFDSKDIKTGTGAAIQNNQYGTFDYTITLVNGKKVTDSTETGPLTFQIGTGKIDSVNKLAAIGLAYAAEGMKVGGIRQVTLPPSIGLGAEASQMGINPNTIAVFKLTLKKISSSAPSS